MQQWTRWFRDKQSAYGTIEAFARASGISVRTVADYRAGRIPRRAQLAKIVAVLGEPGPVPGTPTERVVTIEERIAELEERVSGLEAWRDSGGAR